MWVAGLVFRADGGVGRPQPPAGHDGRQTTEVSRPRRHTLDGLASLDSATARLVATGVDLEHLDLMARTADPSTPVTDLLAGRPKQAERLVEEGIDTVADVFRLSPLTARFGDAGLSDLPQQIDTARAASARHRPTAGAGSTRSPCPGPTSRSTSTWRA